MFQDLLMLRAQFIELDTFLADHRRFWQGMPFDCLELPWRKTDPALCEWLEGESLLRLQALKDSPEELVEHISPWLPSISQYSALCQIPSLQEKATNGNPHWISGIPGKKCAQILAFNQAIPALPGEHWLEWCAGKGYLGRLLSFSRQAKVTSLEWQKTLCDEGQRYAQKHALPMFFVQGDAFLNESQRLIEKCDHVVALHACGDLHVTLLEKSIITKPLSVTVSPCCYHLIRSKTYQPLSSVAKKTRLTLDRHDLKLPLQETVTAGQSVRKKRYVEITYRLGFDSLQRSLQKKETYLPVPNVKKSLLNEGFEQFCLWAAEQKGIKIPEDTPFQAYQLRGGNRFLLVEQMETIRTLFRRPLEIWLVLDRALFMAENGFDVDVVEFCSREITPRNLLLRAQRKSAQTHIK